MQKLEQSDCGTNKTADQGGVHAGSAEHVIPCIPYLGISQAIADHRVGLPQVVSHMMSLAAATHPKLAGCSMPCISLPPNCVVS